MLPSPLRDAPPTASPATQASRQTLDTLNTMQAARCATAPMAAQLQRRNPRAAAPAAGLRSNDSAQPAVPCSSAALDRRALLGAAAALAAAACQPPAWAIQGLTAGRIPGVSGPDAEGWYVSECCAVAAAVLQACPDVKRKPLSSPPSHTHVHWGTATPVLPPVLRHLVCVLIACLHPSRRRVSCLQTYTRPEGKSGERWLGSCSCAASLVCNKQASAGMTSAGRSAIGPSCLA